MRSHEEIKKIYKECKRDLDALGIRYGNVVSFEIKGIPGHAYGHTECKDLFLPFAERKYTILVSPIWLDERCSISGLRGTIYHELLHSVDGCMNHGEKWHTLACKVQDVYPECCVVVTKDDSDIGISDEVIREWYYKAAKFAIRCNKCGHVEYRNRATNITKSPQRYRCVCGGDLEVLAL